MVRVAAYMCALLVTLGSANEATAQKSQTQIREELKVALKMRHPTEGKAWWLGLGENAPPVIIAMYTESKNTYHRVRLLRGLGWFDDPAAIDFIKEQTRSAKKTVIRRSGVVTIGLTRGEEEIPFLEEFLSDSNAQLRMAAAQGIQRIAKEFSSEKATRLLNSYRKTEKKKWILSKLDKSKSDQSKEPFQRKMKKLDDRWVGEWSGNLLLPDSKKVGVRTAPARISLEYDTPKKLKGILEWTVGQKKTRLHIKDVVGEGTRATATFKDSKSLIDQPFHFKMVLNPAIKPGVGTVLLDLEFVSMTGLFRRK